MIPSRLRTLALGGSGLALVFSTPAMAQQAGQCGQRLDQIEEQVSQADLETQRQDDIQQVVAGARTLAETGDEEGCMRVVAELDDLMTVMEETAGPQAREQAQGGGAQDQQDAGQPQQPTQAGAQLPSSSAKEQIPEQTAEGQQSQDADQQQAGGQQDAGQPQQQQAQGAGSTKQQATEEQQEGQAAQQPQAQPGDQQQQTAASQSPITNMSPNEVVGAEVMNDEGETVAEIVDLVKRKGAEDMYAVLSVGGFLGIGDKEVALPADRIQTGQEDQLVLTNASEDELTNMPEYQEAQYESTIQQQQPAGGQAVGGSEQPPAAAQ